MTTASISPGQVPATAPRWLWAVVALLAASTMALAANLWQTRSAADETAALPSVTVDAPTPVNAGVSAVTQGAAEPPQPPAQRPGATPAPKQKAAHPPQQRAPSATKKVAQQPAQTATAQTANVEVLSGGAMQTAEASLPAPAATPAPVARAVCANCGTVENVTLVQQPGTSTGAGAVAGAALGGLVGNQIGGGSGKTIATLLGVLGGSVAGDAIEKRMKPDIRYRVDVRMEDGSMRTVEQASPTTVGARVTVEGDGLRAAPQ